MNFSNWGLVFESCKELENEGFEVAYLLPEKNGCISEEQLSEAIDENTILVTVMMVNIDMYLVQIQIISLKKEI